MQIKKFKIQPEHLNKKALIVSDNDMEKFSFKAEYDCTINKVSDKKIRSYDQLKLYWQSCRYIAFNVQKNEGYNTSEKVDEQIKIACRFVDFWVYYDNKKTGKQEIHIKTKSISYSNLGNIEACNYFEDAFNKMASLLNMSKDDFIEAVKESVGDKMPLSDKVVDMFGGTIIDD